MGQSRHRVRLAITLLSATCAGGLAHAFDPSEGADKTPVVRPRAAYRTPFVSASARQTQVNPALNLQPLSAPPAAQPPLAPMAAAPAAPNLPPAAPGFIAPPPAAYAPPAPTLPPLPPAPAAAVAQPVYASAVQAPVPALSPPTPPAGFIAPLPAASVALPPLPPAPAGAPTSLPPVAMAANTAPIAITPPEPLPPITVLDQPTQYATPIFPQGKKTQASLGVEGVYDYYREPDTFPDLHTTTYYGSVTGGLTHNFSTKWYGTGEGRVSYGRADYSSSSGVSHDTPQWEGEARLLGGYISPMNNGSGAQLKTYAGLGSRYYRDESKGVITTTGAYGYDRRILQLYLPIGVTYQFQSNGLTFAPNFEIDPLLYGYVESRLQTIPGYEEARNRQVNGGMGWRAEFMVSKLSESGKGWQFGPFIRYWDIKDSEYDYSAGGMEPRNTRLQAGAALKYLF